jgi:hypothetical protein
MEGGVMNGNGNPIVLGRPDGNLSQVAHIPLTAVGQVPGTLGEIKGCKFFPPVTLVVVSHHKVYTPQPGWYDVPDKGYLTWVKGFRVVQVSKPNAAAEFVPGLGTHRAWVFEAIEGQPPVDASLKGGKG